MLGIASRNVHVVQSLSAGLVRCLSTRGINLRTTNFEDVRNVVSRPEDFVVEQAKPFCLAMNHLQSNLLVPHLKDKVDLVGGSYNEDAWLLPDQRLLRDCESVVLREGSFDPIRPFLLELIRGMLTHSQHRPDILELNEGRVIPENGPLIREMYEIADNASIQKANRLLKYFNSKDMFTDSVLRCDIRRLIRNIVRLGATQHNAKLASRRSLTSSMLTFSKRDEKPLSELGFLPLLKKETTTKSEKESLEDEIDTLAIDIFSNEIIDPSPELVVWLDEQSQGFSFRDLVEKYMAQGKAFEESLIKISTNASKPNYRVSSRMAREEPTRVTEKYKNDMIKNDLFRSAFFEGSILKYEIVR